jgi:hypothetical protein
MREILLEGVDGVCILVDGAMSVEEQGALLRRRMGSFVGGPARRLSHRV